VPGQSRVYVGRGVVPPLAEVGLGFFGAASAVYPRTSTAFSVGRNSQPLTVFPSSQIAFVDFPGVLLHSGDLDVELLWTTPATVVGSALWSLSWERDNPTFGPPQEDVDVDAFAPTKSVLSPAPSASGLLRSASISFTPAERGGILLGEACRLRVYRDAGTEPDDLATAAQLFRVILHPA